MLLVSPAMEVMRTWVSWFKTKLRENLIPILALTMVLELNARLAIKNISPALFTATTVMSLSTK